jgi:tetratricopeptide (TPR) repeat protein
MPGDLWAERAKAVTGADGSRNQLLLMAAAVRPDVLSGDRDSMLASPAEVSRTRALVPAWRQTLAAVSSTAAGSNDARSKEFRTYLEASLVCTYSSPDQRDAFVKAMGEGLVPLLEYRAAFCQFADAARLEPLVESGFVDAEFPLGKAALDGGADIYATAATKDYEQALRRLQAVVAEFPESLSARTLIGNIYLEYEEWQAATTAFDAVLALLPSHPDALLGRTNSVSRLGRYQEGIDTATRLIERGNWYVGQALYWRAWNYNALKNYPTARVDANRAKTLMVNAGVFLLSGLIDWSLEQRPTAETEFETALTMDFGQCEAAFYLGGVRAEMRKAPEGIAAFKQANQCYDLATTVRRKLIESVLAGKASEQTKARQIASHQRAITANDERKGQATRLIGELERYLTSLQARPSAPPPSAPARGRP